ncbi:Uncharacterized protein TPAR_02027, partial [Tolypocladium paradoxum]
KPSPWVSLSRVRCLPSCVTFCGRLQSIARLSIPATMAVIPAVPGLTINVKVACQIATEYAPPEEETFGEDQGVTASIPRSTCYIESTSGLSFSVQTTVTPEFERIAPYDALAVRVYIDGQYIHGEWYYKSDINWTRSFIREISSGSTPSDRKGFVVRRTFTFAPVSCVEDVARTRIVQDAKTARSLGVIRVTASVGRGEKAVLYAGNTFRGNQKLELAEKAMKGKELSHGTSFPAGAVGVQPRMVSFNHERDVAEFFFKYRSRGALQRELIIPQSPASTPVLDEIDGLSELEIRRLAREMLRAKQEDRRSERRATVKRENDDTDRTGPAREFKMVRMDDGKEAVDLTDD